MTCAFHFGSLPSVRVGVINFSSSSWKSSQTEKGKLALLQNTRNWWLFYVFSRYTTSTLTMSDEEEIYISSDDEGPREEGSEEDSDESGPENLDSNDHSPILMELWKIVSGLKAPGTFACGGSMKLILPGFGSVGLPLSEHDAKEIIKLCQRAPFGRGEKTIVDTTVRNTWQLNPSEVQLLNEEFVGQINSLVTNTVAVELGLGSSANVDARLYKMLLYEPGGFFLPHKDTEKEKGMFASLVVTLPSTFEGGELIVTHKGMSKTFKPEKPSYNMSYVSFFADCKHEIKPVTSGYRLALVYNVVSLSKGPLPSPAANQTAYQAQQCIQKWKKSKSAPSKAVFLLQHQYTPSGLSVNVLKNKDRAMVQVLQEAIKDEGFDLFLGLLDKTKSGSVEYSGYRSYHMEEVYEEDISLNSLVNANGERTDADIPIDDSDVYPPKAFNDDNADSESMEGDTGNEGASMELRYHRAVVVLWPKDRWIDIICEGSKPEAVRYMKELLSKCSLKGPKNTPDWQNVKKMAKILASQVAMDPDFLEALLKIDDLELLKDHLRQAKSRIVWYPHGEEGGKKFLYVLDKCLEKYGWNTLSEPLLQFATSLSTDTTLSFLLHFCAFKIDDKTAIETLLAITRNVVKVKYPADSRFNNDMNRICNLAKVVSVLDPTLFTDVFKYLKDGSKDMDKNLIPTLRKMHELVPSISERQEFINITKQCITALEKRVNAANARPSDWSVQTVPSCTCAECKEVTKFLKSPTLTVFKHKAVQGTRKHMEESAGGSRYSRKLADILKFDTERTSSPQVLVITKIAKEADAEKKKAKNDEITIATLNSILEGPPVGTERATKRQKVSQK